MHIKNIVRAGLETLCDNSYKKELQLYKEDYSVWAASLKESYGSMDNENAASVEEAAFTMLTFPDTGEWTADAKESIARYFALHPEVDVIYTDEEFEACPVLKPAWSPDAFLDGDYLGNAVAVRNSLFDCLKAEEKEERSLCHKRVVELAEGFSRGCNRIAHVPGIYFKSVSVGEGVVYNEDSISESCPLVSVVIPSKDHPQLLSRCIKTLVQTSGGVPLQVIVVDNGSNEDNRKQIGWEIHKLKEDLTIEVLYLYEEESFNFAKMCNKGAKEATGEVLLFLNDDIEAISCGWLQKMCQKAVKPYVGAVGVKLLYPDTNRIQHAGIFMVGCEPVHKLQLVQDEKTDKKAPLQLNNKCYLQGTHNVLAVTGACLMIRRSLFEEVGGFCQKLAVAYNDVDLCYTIYEHGYFNVVLNDVSLIHHESLSRGADVSAEKKERLNAERTLLRERHPHLTEDPFYHKGLTQNPRHAGVIPSYLLGKVMEDQMEWTSCVISSDTREDACLMIGIEELYQGKIKGYTVVLGSNNACYDKKMLLKHVIDGSIYEGSFKKQYRYDIEENMRDQTNVALCGFECTFDTSHLSGEYLIGMLATDKISKNRLINWTNEKIVV